VSDQTKWEFNAEQIPGQLALPTDEEKEVIDPDDYPC